jgi:hypothetical protein
VLSVQIFDFNNIQDKAIQYTYGRHGFVEDYLIRDDTYEAKLYQTLNKTKTNFIACKLCKCFKSFLIHGPVNSDVAEI